MSYKNYMKQIITVIKEEGKQLNLNFYESERELNDFKSGEIMGYYEIISSLKSRAEVLDFDLKELGLNDINPESDILSFRKNRRTQSKQ